MELTTAKLDIMRQTAYDIRQASKHNMEKLHLYIGELVVEVKRLREKNKELSHTVEKLDNENKQLVKRLFNE